ncbi:hypothetical protein EDM56_26355 [Brevibacillus fluminis]|uniref:Uncharacterized protein n=1 Tax=Brevibacillus fluminis TaxID=511487 RepID=A0A3M8CZK7_9BACL|nr:PepSY-associated TM helix domain-containing protein [Brevibacillus fluminis]RNB81240.1 hypothetical protein EDM56_26355 [Brevibacillus fluminis]
MTVRKIMLKVHLWLSLLVGLFLVAICTSGSILVFKDEINVAIHSNYYKPLPPTGTTISVEELTQIASKAFPGYHTNFIDTPEYIGGVYRLWLNNEENKIETYKHVLIDPGTGKVLGGYDVYGGFMGFLDDLHIHLLMKKDFGLGEEFGIYSVGIVGLVFLVILVTGIYVWWPGIRKWVSGFKVIYNKGIYFLNRDLHKSIGIISVPLLLILALTGAAFVFDETIFGWFGSQPYSTPPVAIESTPNGQNRMPLDEFFKIAKKEYPDFQANEMYVPGEPKEAVQVYMSSTGYDPTLFGNVRVYIDQYTGKVIWKSDPTNETTAGMYDTWRTALHYGFFGGEIVKVIYFIFGMMPLVLMITGLVVWRYKANLKKKSKKKAQEKVA